VFFGPGQGEKSGIARRSFLLSRGLAARGWDVLFVARSPSRWTFGVCHELPSLTVVDVPGYGADRLSTALFLAVAVPIGLLQGRRTSVYVGMKLASPSLAAATCGAVARRPFLAVGTTSGDEGEAAHLAAGGIGSMIKRKLVGRARFVVAQHTSAARELSALVPPGRVAVVPTPVVLCAPPPLTGEPSVVFTGRLSRDKDLSGLLRAWVRVMARHPSARLTLVGAAGRHEPFEKELRQIVAADPVLQGSVRFTGWVDDVSLFLAAADVFVLPSLGHQEGMSNALVEACACGRVVVASDIPGNRAVLGDDYPLLFPPGDALRLGETLDRALSDDRLRSSARAQVSDRVERFSVESVVDRLEELLVVASLEKAGPGPGRRPFPAESDDRGGAVAPT
jgi:glycosyltransferase involved in cell wall biosynthesis